MTLSEELTWRGFVNQMTFADITDVNEPRTLYWGVDPSADSMTIGHLAPAMMIRHFLNYGHKAILLAGGATGLIGDPDGKKQERDIKSEEEVVKNVAGLVRQYHHIFSGHDFDIVNNIDWFRDMGYLQFLREVGKNASMTQMLDREFIKERIGEGGSGISYAEFSYALIQGYDFLHLFREKGATLQVAGADQWGNSLTGVDLIRRIEGAESHVFTTPLIINKQTGVKFGKSEAGAVWLDPSKTSPYKFYQFWLNCDDETSEDLVKIYTLLNRERVEKLISDHKENKAARELQKVLAYEVTKLVHGEERVESILRVTDSLFGEKHFSELSEVDIDMLSAEVPTTPVGKSLVESLVETGIVSSKGEARRLIESGAISVNGIKTLVDLTVVETSLVKKGKNTFLLVC